MGVLDAMPSTNLKPENEGGWALGAGPAAGQRTARAGCWRGARAHHPRVLTSQPSAPLVLFLGVPADEELEANRVYRTTYMFSATMPPAVERLAR